MGRRAKKQVVRMDPHRSQTRKVAEGVDSGDRATWSDRWLSQIASPQKGSELRSSVTDRCRGAERKQGSEIKGHEFVKSFCHEYEYRSFQWKNVLGMFSSWSAIYVLITICLGMFFTFLESFEYLICSIVSTRETTQHEQNHRSKPGIFVASHRASKRIPSKAPNGWNTIWSNERHTG